MRVRGGFHDAERIVRSCIFLADIEEIADINIRRNQINMRCSSLPDVNHLRNRTAGGILAGRTSLRKPCVDEHRKIVFRSSCSSNLIYKASRPVGLEGFLCVFTEAGGPGLFFSLRNGTDGSIRIGVMLRSGGQCLQELLRNRIQEAAIRLCRAFPCRAHDAGLIFHLHHHNGVLPFIKFAKVPHQRSKRAAVCCQGFFAKYRQGRVFHVEEGFQDNLVAGGLYLRAGESGKVLLDPFGSIAALRIFKASEP